MQRLTQNLGSLCACLLMLACLASAVVAADPLLTFDKVVEYLDLEVKQEKIIKMVEDSPTVFTLGADQVELLRTKGASDELLEAVQKKTQPGAGAAAAAGTDITDFVLILDASGSMKDKTSDGSTKWDAARQAAIDLIAAVPDGKNLALVVYGHNKEQGCEAAETLRPLSPMTAKSRAGLTAAVNRLQPIGHTPIALSLALAGREIGSSEGLSKVVLITDGIETCKGDPVAAAKELAGNPKLTGGVDVIGFGLNDKESIAVAKIAQEGRGTYYNAKDARALVKSVRAVEAVIASAPPKAKSPKSASKPSTDFSAPAVLALGEFAAGRLGKETAHFLTIELPPGDYIAVADLKMADGSDSNLQLGVQLDGDTLIGTNDVDRVTRGAKAFHSEGREHLISIENSSGVIDYNFAIYRADDKLPRPYISFADGELYEIALGKKYAVKLDPKTLSSRSTYFRFKLDEGEYAIEYLFHSPTAKSNYGARIAQLDELGVPLREIGYEYIAAKSAAIKRKLIIPEDQELFLRITCFDGFPIEGAFSVTKVRGAAAAPAE